MLLLLPQFGALENDLNSAATGKDSGLAVRTLKSLSSFATTLAENLKGQDQADQALIGKLDTFAEQATLAKGAVSKVPKGRDIGKLTEDIHDRLSGLSLDIIRLSAKQEFTLH